MYTLLCIKTDPHPLNLYTTKYTFPAGQIDTTNFFCQVTGKRRYSSDLVQGGVEIPCTLTFSGTDCNLMTKVQS